MTGLTASPGLESTHHWPDSLSSIMLHLSCCLHLVLILSISQVCSLWAQAVLVSLSTIIVLSGTHPTIPWKLTCIWPLFSSQPVQAVGHTWHHCPSRPGTVPQRFFPRSLCVALREHLACSGLYPCSLWDSQHSSLRLCVSCSVSLELSY